MIEIVGAIALAFPGLAALGALWLGFAMLCAAAMNLFVLHSSPMPAFSLGFLNALIIYARRDEIRALASRIRG
ncbi:hypothetical protein B5V02_09190 [Mesorhizobium kowhaii]|uniref:DoxX family protein n=1 Tax=Mesorhizobium kowhaii TaxID=1300272 RepID=A0A2W7CAU7_9HYPH|nr:hypothetical protein B5V02_09190 [Mesorhizobium kowhaii]